MKKLIIVLLALGSFSAFAQNICDNVSLVVENSKRIAKFYNQHKKLVLSLPDDEKTIYAPNGMNPYNLLVNEFMYLKNLYPGTFGWDQMNDHLRSLDNIYYLKNSGRFLVSNTSSGFVTSQEIENGLISKYGYLPYLLIQDHKINYSKSILITVTQDMKEIEGIESTEFESHSLSSLVDILTLDGFVNKYCTDKY